MAKPSSPEGEDGMCVTARCLRFAHTVTKSIISVVVSEIAPCYRTGQAVHPITLTNICTIYA